MAEDPIKLFPTRAERYPQADDADVAREALKTAIQSVPVVGDTTAFVLSRWLTPALEKRKEEWLKELADAVSQLELKVEGFRVENLVKDEAFVTATVQASRIAMATHQQEKRRMLRNALISIASGNCDANDDLQQTFLSAVEQFTPTHVQVLNFLWVGINELTRAGIWDPLGNRYSIPNYGKAIEALHPELRGRLEFVQYLTSDLRNRGFTNLSGVESAFPQSPAITNMGIQFLRFVQDRP